MRTLSEELLGPIGQPIGYVSFLSALSHHGISNEGVARIQVASPDRAGELEVAQGTIEYHLLPEDLWFGHRETLYEGERVPVATPEKALIDWCWLAEELGLDPRLDELDWDLLDVSELDRLADRTGVAYRQRLPPRGESGHDQDRLREESLGRLRP